MSLTAAYELALLGAPTAAQAREVGNAVSQVVREFGFRLGNDVGWAVRPSAFNPSERRSAAAIYFGTSAPTSVNVGALVARKVPIVPVVSSLDAVHTELPRELQGLNAVAYADAGPGRLASALLECAGLLPRQRRVFVSYRRKEARQAALQLFDAFSARLFDVFLDTRGVPPGGEFQTILWHRLCESDVLVMLDTPTYFESRWTAAEFGRALAKGIAVLQVVWPSVSPSARTATASRILLGDGEVSARSGRLSRPALDRVVSQLELVRSESIAVRRLNMVSRLSDEVKRIGGNVRGVGQAAGVHLDLPSGKSLVVYPTIGIPTALSLHEASLLTSGPGVAVLYDQVGISREWLDHLTWLGGHISAPRCVSIAEAGWDLADWDADT